MDKRTLKNTPARRAIYTGFAVNGLLAVVKLTAGILGRSAAMVADGTHSLSDLFSDVVVLFGIRMTEVPEDEGHNYGHGKYETLGTFVIGIFLFLVGFEILKSGSGNILSVLRGTPLDRPGMIALWAAVLSITVKEALYQYTIRVSRNIKSPVLRANAWHQRSDALSSLGVLAGIAGAMFLGPRWVILDPVASVVVSLFIFKVAAGILKPSLDELLESSLEDSELQQIQQILVDYPDVQSYHKLRTRRIGRRAAIEFHILVDPRLGIRSAHRIATDIELRIREIFGKNSIVTIHVEPLEES